MVHWAIETSPKLEGGCHLLARWYSEVMSGPDYHEEVKE